MKRFFVFVCLVVFSVSHLGVCKAAQKQKNGVYIVYMGAAAASSNNGAMRKDHAQLMTSLSQRKRNALVHCYTNGFSGFAAWLTEEEAQSIAQKPGVVSVFPDPVLQLHTTRSWDFLESYSGQEIYSRRRPRSAPAQSSSSGADTIIGILDSGIWPESASFSDAGMGPIPARWKGTCEQGDDFNSSDCNRKIIGARFYTAASARDHGGHGTHVASIAVGSLVDGASYYGLAKGTAKGGSLGSRIAVYQVCESVGYCQGSAILKAFDDAIKDGVDVLSVSVGGAGGSKPDYSMDPVAIGAFHAVEKGIVVVCSAGNGGPDTSSVVNDAPWIFTVAASTIDRDFQSQIILGGGNKVIKGGGIHFGQLKKIPAYPLATAASVKSENETEFTARNCLPESLDAAKVKGKIILCKYTNKEYGIQDRMDEVKRQGGIGVIIVSDGDRLAEPKFGTFPGSVIVEKDGDKILAYINSTRNPVATILPTVTKIGKKPAPVIIGFSGKGPSLATKNLVKPDISAPGVNILAAWPEKDLDAAIPGKNPPSYNIVSGTSTSCPHASAIVAAVKAQNPAFSESAIRSAIMTTAIQRNNLNAPITIPSELSATPYDFGAGEASPTASLEPGLVYETKTTDYVLFLCALGYDTLKIRLISSTLPKNFECPQNLSRDSVSNINYPSIAISRPMVGKSNTITRTATNVGDEESVYTATVEAPTSVKVVVTPSKLVFTKNVKKLAYKVTFTATPSIPQINLFGSITWTSGKYIVRSPIVVTTAVVST